MTSAVDSRRTRVSGPDVVAVVVLTCGAIEVTSWPLTVRGSVDVSLVDDVARLHLAARRLGCTVRLRHACPELSELLELAGLAKIEAGGSELGLQARGKAESGEQVGVEEVVMPDDPIA